MGYVFDDGCCPHGKVFESVVREAPDYEARVEQMAAALHKECQLAADARYALNPMPDPWRGDRHEANRHYGQAHDLVRRIWPELDVT